MPNIISAKNRQHDFYDTNFNQGGFLGHIDLPLVLARHVTSLLWGEGFKLGSTNAKIDKFLNDFSVNSRLQLTFEKVEQLLSTTGRAVLTIDKSETGHIYLSVANPAMLNKVGRVFVQENSAVVWKRIFFDDRMFWSRQTYDTEKVVTQIYGGGPIPNGVNNETPIDDNTTPFNANGEANLNNLVTVGHVAKIMNKLRLVPVWYHNLGVCPLVELFNLPDYLFDWTYVGHNPDLRAEAGTLQTTLTNLITVFNQSLFYNQTRVLTSINPRDLKRAKSSVSALANNPALGGLFLQHSATGENARTLIDVIQNKVQAQDYIGAIHETLSLAFFVAGYNYDGQPQKADLTATGSMLGRERDIQSTKRKRTYRTQEYYRLLDKVLVVAGLMRPDEPRKYTFNIRTNILFNSLIMAQTHDIQLKNKTTSRLRVIMEREGLTQPEAKIRLEEIDQEALATAERYGELLKETAPVETKQIIQEAGQNISPNNNPRKRTPSDFQKGVGS